MIKHQHEFYVDTCCDCGLMLSDYVRSLTALNKELVAALEKFNQWLTDGFIVRDVTKDSQSDWAIKMMSFVTDLNKIQAVLAIARSVEVE